MCGSAPCEHESYHLVPKPSAPSSSHEEDSGDVHPSKPRECVRSRDGVGCHEEGSCQEVLSLPIPSVNMPPHSLCEDEFVHSVSRHHSNEEVQQKRQQRLEG